MTDEVGDQKEIIARQRQEMVVSLHMAADDILLTMQVIHSAKSPIAVFLAFIGYVPVLFQGAADIFIPALRRAADRMESALTPTETPPAE